MAATNYVGKNAIATVGGVVSVDTKLNVVSDLVRILECTDLTKVRSLPFCWGQTQICYRIA